VLPKRIKQKQGKVRERKGDGEGERLRFFQTVKYKIAVTMV